MAKKTNAKTTVKDAVAKKETKVSTRKKSTKKVEKKQLVEAIFLNKKSKDVVNFFISHQKIRDIREALFCEMFW